MIRRAWHLRVSAALMGFSLWDHTGVGSSHKALSSDPQKTTRVMAKRWPVNCVASQLLSQVTQPLSLWLCFHLCMWEDGLTCGRWSLAWSSSRSLNILSGIFQFAQPVHICCYFSFTMRIKASDFWLLFGGPKLLFTICLSQFLYEFKTQILQRLSLCSPMSSNIFPKSWNNSHFYKT